MKHIILVTMLGLILAVAACAPAASSPAIPENTAVPEVPLQTLEQMISDCHPTPLIKPTEAAVIPGFAQLDETTGLHMTGTVQNVDPGSFRLEIKGKVDRPRSLTLEQLRCLPKITEKTTIQCKGNFEDTTTFSGVPLRLVLNLAGVQMGAKAIDLVGADGYESYVPLKDAYQPDNFLAYQWKDEALPILHGFPLRAVLPGQLGSTWTKWLVAVRVE